MDENEGALAEFEWKESESLSARLIEEVGALVGEDPIEIESLYNRVDPDALDAIFRSTKIAGDRAEGFVEFPFAGYQICVSATGMCRIFEGGANGETEARSANG
jgi:hypothetical protein